MEAQELLKQLNELKSEVEKTTTEKAKSEISKEVKSIEDKIKGLDQKAEKAQVDELKGTIDELKRAMDANQPEIDKLIAQKNEQPANRKVKSLGEIVAERILANHEKLINMGSGKMMISNPDQVKAAGTMTDSNVTPVGTNSIPFLLADIEPGLTRIVRRQPFLMQLCNVGVTSKPYVQWAEQANADPGAAGMTAEGSAKTQTDFDVVEKAQKVEKVTAYIKVSKEMLDDVDFIQQEINNELVELVMLKADDQIFQGNGTSPNLKGITQFAQSFSAGALANALQNVQDIDVLRAAIAQVSTGLFYPNYIALSPGDAALLDLAKDAYGAYVIPPFMAADRTMIKGVRVIENTLIPSGQFLIGDFTKSNVRVRQNLGIQVGYENDDFTKNLVTIICEMRLTHFIKANHANAFVYDSFATAKAAISSSI